MDHNYYSTLIAVADDCPATAGVVPPEGAKLTVANVHYQMLAGKPFKHTQEDVLFAAWFERQDLPRQTPAQIAQLREEFFAKPKPCLRTSPLAKRYGWGFVFDTKGRVKLVPMESPEYRDLLGGGAVKVLKAMKSSR